jgi:hypothetical protein
MPADAPVTMASGRVCEAMSGFLPVGEISGRELGAAGDRSRCAADRLSPHEALPQSTNATVVPLSTMRASARTSQLVSRTQPWE